MRSVSWFAITHSTPPVTPIGLFCFGSKEDENGNAYVGKGTDSDSFVVGISCLALVHACIEYASPSCFTLFHADVTFKLSDLGYPVITCVFSDSWRSYQLAAISLNVLVYNFD
ncbi:hypothetical protein L915_08863 [Phytophthora nicotianae]|uniref:Uncharacterized protein n=1 Tax=Phytophthora nicotianae TaxID=4792 RepID=W2GUH0_PHYNI|nr:hypothetical protein L915_08863 [Phytophthora nicotianae]